MKKPIRLSTAAFAIILADGAYAGGYGGFYVGGSIGQSEANLSSDDLFVDFACNQAAELCEEDNSDNAYEVHGGLQITESIAIELGFIDFGESSINVGFAPGSAYTSNGNNSNAAPSNNTSPDVNDPYIRQSTKAITAAVVGKKKLTDRFSLYGKAGMAAWETKAQLTSIPPDAYYPEQEVKDDGFDPFLGVGVEYELTDNMSVRAGYERYFNIGSAESFAGDGNNFPVELDTIEQDIDFYSVGVNYSF